jgi:hypothetical protein
LGHRGAKDRGDRKHAASIRLVTYFRQLGDEDERVQQARGVIKRREQNADAD